MRPELAGPSVRLIALIHAPPIRASKLNVSRVLGLVSHVDSTTPDTRPSAFLHLSDVWLKAQSIQQCSLYE